MSEGHMTAEQTPDIEAVLRTHVLAGSSIWAAECSCGEQEGVDYYAHVTQALAPVLAAAVREARAAAWDEGREATKGWVDECFDADVDAMPNPYRADRIAVDAPEHLPECRQFADGHWECPRDHASVDAPEGGEGR